MGVSWRVQQYYCCISEHPFLYSKYNYLAQSEALPTKISKPWERESIIKDSDSSTAFGLPGIFIIRVDFLIPAAALESIALFVILIE